ncbi:MAG: hypothetical protein IT240_04165 [Bacteroidia bacterium]|nr:hypothetical protein [Bacteroidia bacterium]MCC6768216.1 hypothetical protein [Bacteroidia bacterium]
MFNGNVHNKTPNEAINCKSIRQLKSNAGQIKIFRAKWYLCAFVEVLTGMITQINRTGLPGVTAVKQLSACSFALGNIFKSLADE